jgi:hypothetical protein
MVLSWFEHFQQFENLFFSEMQFKIAHFSFKKVFKSKKAKKSDAYTHFIGAISASCTGVHIWKYQSCS